MNLVVRKIKMAQVQVKFEDGETASFDFNPDEKQWITVKMEQEEEIMSPPGAPIDRQKEYVVKVKGRFVSATGLELFRAYERE